MNELPTWRYRICLRLVSPLLLLHLFWRSCRDGGWRYFRERLGFFHKDKLRRIHIHAASVGEIITVLPLVEKMQLTHSELAFLITTNTPTGASILDQRLQGQATHCYLPIDFSGATDRFFRGNNISCSWIVETEIWPWVFSRAKRDDIPIAVINARLSQKSRGAVANCFDQTYRQALRDVAIFARSKEDAERYKKRGANPEIVSTLGNLKYAQPIQLETPPALVDNPYVLAASTHEDEELQLAQVWLHSSINHLLVIAPRHAERGTRLIKSLNALQTEVDPTLPKIAQRSQGQLPAANSKLYLADTLGEMQAWYAHADAAFVGGSLIKRGGHNVLEPARMKTPIVVGIHTFNFVEEVSLLKDVKGISIADNADEAVELLALAVADKDWALNLSSRAYAATNAQNNILDSYCATLSDFVSKSSQT